MLIRNLYAVMCVVALLLMGITATNDSAKSDLADGDCQCQVEKCPGAIAGTEVDCEYKSQTFHCECPWQEYKFFTDAVPRLRTCVDGPNAGDMSCECKCAGTDAPGCKDCVSTCNSVDAVAPNPDPCEANFMEPYRCGATKCSPKNPHSG